MPAQTATIASNLIALLQGLPTTLLTTCNTQITASGSLQTVTPLAPSGMNGITNGMEIMVDAANQESVAVANVTGSTFQAIFSLNHIGTWTIGIGPALYNMVLLGSVQDPTDIASYAQVTFQSRKTERYDAGWNVNSTPIFQIESGFDLTGANTSTVEKALMNTADILTYLFVQRYTFNSAPQGVYVTLVDVDDTAAYKMFPNGRIYRVHHAYAKGINQYRVSITP